MLGLYSSVEYGKFVGRMSIFVSIALLLNIYSLAIPAPWFITAIQAGIVIIILSFCMSLNVFTLSRKGTEAKSKCEALKRFLNDYSNIKEATMQSLAIWEDYLIYAIVLGVADNIEKQFKNIFGEEIYIIKT